VLLLPCSPDCSHHMSCINRVPIFHGMTAEQICMLQQVTNNRSFLKGEYIFREGDPSETLYIVNKGLIKIHKSSESGKEQIFRLLFPGDFFGQSALLKTEYHYANAEAIDKTDICTINKQDFINTMEQNSGMAFRFMLALNERLYQADEWMSLLSLMEVEKRLASALLLFSKTGEIKNGKFTLPISKKILASLLGTTPETISRKLVFLVKENIIQMDGRREITILDYESLNQLARP